MYIITFYSFKGGVGRTMALVNTGAELARRGCKVLLVDFDLEAPGLSTYGLLRPDRPRPGLVEYVAKFCRDRKSPMVKDFIYQAQSVGKQGGELWVMPAGRGDAEYRALLNGLNWRSLYQGDKPGFLLFEDTRLQWEADLHPEYVLIDARTGHTDIEGICTRQLADAVVAVFHPNDQNLDGLREVCRHIRAEQTGGLRKKIQLHFVASNVPLMDDEHGVLRRHLAAFAGDLRIPRPGPIVIHRYESLRMLDQPVFVLQRPHSRLAHEYKRLVRSLIVYNAADRRGALLFLRELQKDESHLLGRVQWTGNSANARPRNDTIVARMEEFLGAREQRRQDISRMVDIDGNFQNDLEVLKELARCQEKLGHRDWAVRRLDRVLELQRDRPEPDILLHRALLRRQLKNHVGAAEDLLRFLRLPDAKKRIHLEQIVLQLLDVSIDAFLKALSEPALQEQLLTPRHWELWLDTVGRVLIREGRWEEAIRYFESTANELIGQVYGHEPIEMHYSQFQRALFLTMAYWGQTGSLSPDLCRRALEQFLASGLSDTSNELPASEFQILSLLTWGVGNPDKALILLDRAITRLHEDGESDLESQSYWTLAETTSREFLYDCSQQRRMIQGEPIHPEFLPVHALP